MTKKSKSRKQKGGVETTVCADSRGRVACYGSVECDFTGDYPSCIQQGFVENQPNNSKDYIDTIKDSIKNYSNRMRNNKMRREKVNKIRNKMNRTRRVVNKKDLRKNMVNNVMKNEKVENNVKQLSLSNHFIEEIKAGKKMVEIKVLNKNTEDIKEGDIVEFVGNGNSVKTVIKSISKHRNLETALRNGTLKRTLPEDVRSISDGVDVLRKSLGGRGRRTYVNFRIELLKKA